MLPTVLHSDLQATMDMVNGLGYPLTCYVVTSLLYFSTIVILDGLGLVY